LRRRRRRRRRRGGGGGEEEELLASEAGLCYVRSVRKMDCRRLLGRSKR